MNPQVLNYLPIVSPVATLIVIMMGVLFNNHHVDVRISDMDRRISDLRSEMNARFDMQDRLFQERLRRIEEILDARLSRIEEHLNLR